MKTFDKIVQQYIDIELVRILRGVEHNINPLANQSGIAVVDDSFLNDVFERKDISVNVHVHALDVLLPPKKHKHQFFELIYIYRGTFLNTIDDVVYEMKAGDVCLMNHDAVHQLQSTDEDDVAINIGIRKDFFNTFFFDMILKNTLFSSFLLNSIYRKGLTNGNYLFFDHHYIDREAIEVCLNQLLHSAIDEQIFHENMQHFQIACLFIELARSFYRRIGTSTEKPDSSNRFEAIILYLSEHLKTANITNTAEYFGYHPKYFPNYVKTHTGQSFTELLQNMRISHACYLLSSTTMNIDDIAIEIGYTGRAYFTRIFEKIMHVTPAKYRISPSKTINLEDRLVNYLYFPVKSQI